MEIRVKLFAQARDLAGQDELSVSLPEPATVADLRWVIADEYPRLASLLSRSAIAINNDFSSDQSPLTPGCEVAVLPPVSGGHE